MATEGRSPTDERPAAEGATTQGGMTPRSERVSRWFQAPLLVVAVLAIPTIVVQELDLGRPWEGLAAALDWLIWGVFALNLAVMLVLVSDRRRWLLDNPLDVLIVVLTPPFLPATFKIARALPIIRLVWLFMIARRTRGFFSLTGLRYVALIALTIVLGGGTFFPLVEPEQNLSIWDGLWWATETVTTVAYGDIYPRTAAGRMVATVVMLTGIGFVALLTGSLAQRFLHGQVDPDEEAAPAETEMTRKIEELTAQIADLRNALHDRRE